MLFDRPRILPVIDLLQGHVVRGLRGDRGAYRPIESRLVAGSEPYAIAKALVDHIHPAELYLADLDAIQGATPAFEVWKAIRSLRVPLWVDAGVRTRSDAEQAARHADHVVVGLETVAGPEELGRIVAAIGADRIVFSIDLRDGSFLKPWPGNSTGDLLTDLDAFGIHRVIVLDLARVGTGDGTGTGELCRQIARRYPAWDRNVGGGVSGIGDFARLAEEGATGVLVASALHDGRII
jgi:HisA/HisF family protein